MTLTEEATRAKKSVSSLSTGVTNIASAPSAAESSSPGREASTVLLAAQLELLLKSRFHRIGEIGGYRQNGFVHRTTSSFRWSRIGTDCISKVLDRTVS